MAPNRTKTNKSVEINRADFSIFNVRLFKKDLTPIPKRTGRVTIKNILNAIPVREIDSGKLESPINPIDIARTIGTLTALTKLITAVMTAVMSLVSAVSVPIVLAISIGLIGDSSLPESISLTGIALSMFLIVTLPVLLGMGVRSFLNSLTLKIEKSARFISTLLFVLVLLGAILAERENVVSYFAQTGLVVLTLNILMMLIAFYWSGFFGTGMSQKKAIAIECGLQNGTLAIFVGTTVFGGGLYIIPAATYSLIMYLTSLLFIYFIKNR